MSSILVIILSSDMEIFCIPKIDRVINISNEELFFIYSVIFTIINIFLLKYSRNLEPSISKKKLILFLILVINQLIIASSLFAIYGQIKVVSLYYSALFYIVISASLIFISSLLDNRRDSVSEMVCSG